MEKAELVEWLENEQRQLMGLLDEIGLGRMALPGVNGEWSMKDVVAHLNGWQVRLIADVRAAGRGQPEPPPPWPAELESDDEVNAWIYEVNKGRAVNEVMEECRQLFDEYVAVVEGLPDDVSIEREWRLLTIGDRRFAAGGYFDHFHDEHEADVRAWLERVERAGQ
jgi:hypothetical protein